MVGFSVIPLLSALFRRSFAAAGLQQRSLDIDSDTTIRFWASKSLTALPPLLLIHGFGPSSTWQWRNQVGPLSRHFSLIVPDLIFFGGSTTRSGRRSELFQAESIVKLVDALLGPEAKFSVAGTSYGGFVAYHVARACGGGRVPRAVIASSDVLKAEEDDRLLLERAGMESVEEVMLPRSTGALRKLMALSAHRQPMFMPEFLLRDVVRNLYSQNLKEKMELIKGITLGKEDGFQFTPLPQDVLIIWGDDDRIFPLDKAYKLKELLGERAKLEIVKNTGHVPNFENPQRFNEVLLAFLLEAPQPSE